MNSSLLNIIKTYGLLTNKIQSKKLGQNFILDSSILGRIASFLSSLEEAFDIIEIGPGPGGLTRELLKTSAQTIYAVEKDEKCIKALGTLESESKGRLKIIEGDALVITPQSLSGRPIILVGNLPYNISTVLLVKWLSNLSQIRQMVLMFQKEVAERIISPFQKKSYGRLSVISQYTCDIRLLFHLSPGSFCPPPAVTSSVLSFFPKNLTVQEQNLIPVLQNLLRIIFSKRRKMIKSSLSFPGFEKEELLQILAEEGIVPTNRAEDLTIKEFYNLAVSLKDKSFS